MERPAQNELTNERTKSFRHPAAERLARLIVSGIDIEVDPRSAVLWAKYSASSVGSIRDACRAVAIGERDALCLARGLRAVFLAIHETQTSGYRTPPEVFLDIVVRRFRERFVDRLGLEDTTGRDVGEFLRGQRITRDEVLLRAIETEFRRRQSAVDGNRSGA